MEFSGKEMSQNRRVCLEYDMRLGVVQEFISIHKRKERVCLVNALLDMALLSFNISLQDRVFQA